MCYNVYNKEGGNNLIELYFAGKLTKQIHTQLYNLGVNKLYSYINDRDMIEHWCKLVKECGKKGKLFIDSGAFTAWTQNRYINVDDYIHFINDRSEYIDYYGQLDFIPGKINAPATPTQVSVAAEYTWQNYIYMYYKMKNPQGLMYTFHVGEPLWQLRRAMEWKDKQGRKIQHMALGGMVGKNRQTQISFIEKCFDVIKHSSNPDVKVHAFGLIVPSVLENYPFYSADSAGWVQSGQNGCIYVPEGVVLISDQQKSKKEHLYNNPQNIDKVSQYVNKFGYTIKQLEVDYAARCVYNILFLVDWANNCSYTKNKVTRRRLF